MIHVGISKTQQLDSERHHEAMIKMTTSEKAKAWFRRKPYDIKRGDAGGRSSNDRERAEESVSTEI